MDTGRAPDTLTLLEAQLGVATRLQFRALGWSYGQIDGAVRQGRLEVIHRGVYRVPGGGIPPGQAAMAAVLRIGSGARVSGESVLAHHHLGDVMPDALGIVLVAPPRRPRAIAIPWRVDGAPDHDGAALGPIPGTSVDRALVEVAGDWDDHTWLAAFDAARWRRLASTAGILKAADRIDRRHAGVRQVRRLAASGELAQESHGERNLAAALEAIGVKRSEVRWQVQVSPGRRADALLTEHRLVIEYDGRDFHTDPRDRAKDAARDRELTALGYGVLRLRAEDLRDHRRLRARLDEAIAAASEHPRAC